MEIAILIVLSVCVILLALVVLKQKRNQEELDGIKDSYRRTENSLAGISSSIETRLDEMGKRSLDLNTLVDSRLESFRSDNDKLVKTVETKLEEIRKDNENRLEKMRETVDQKLQSTLESRIATSFDQVSKQLESVYKQLGEMQTLAKDVGNLEKVLTNVKTRGIWGEIQAERILQDMLLPEQYDKNVITKRNTQERVEFAVKLPGASDGEKIYLPIDAKFPREDYEKLCEASEQGDRDSITALRKALAKRVEGEAKDIRDKYIDVPFTTDFGILFLPVEGLYAEVLSITGLQEKLQRDFHVMVAGPATLSGLLNSLQMGFRTLAIEKKSAQVWKLLGEVKAEYAKLGAVLDGVKKKLASASNEIDNAFTRHRAMERCLRDVVSTQEVQMQEIQAQGALETASDTKED